jgi:hypothetical protein
MGVEGDDSRAGGAVVEAYLFVGYTSVRLDGMIWRFSQ